MRGSGRRTVVKIGAAVGVQTGQRLKMEAKTFEKTTTHCAVCPATRAMAVAAAIGVGRAILAGMGVGAGIAGCGTMHRIGMRNGVFGSCACLNGARRGGHPNGKQEQEYVQAVEHFSGSKGINLV
jgi:hypothetical protein